MGAFVFVVGTLLWREKHALLDFESMYEFNCVVLIFEHLPIWREDTIKTALIQNDWLKLLPE